MNKLKACHYCGGVAKVKKSIVPFCDYNIDKYYIECSECGASTDQYDTHFGYSINGSRFHVMTEKEAIKAATDDWNNHRFNIYTKLSHMSYREKIVWQIETLLSGAWYGAMLPTDSLEYKTGWELREIAEGRKLLKLHSGKDYDLGEISEILFNDSQVKDIIFGYLIEVNNMDLDPEGIREWNYYFNRFFDGEEYLKPSIKDRISDIFSKNWYKVEGLSNG